MSYETRLKTGFYETTLYDLSITQGKVQFIPVRGATKDIIEIIEDNLITITLTRKKHPKVEIQARDRTFTGTFTQNPDLREVQQALKKHIHKKIIYEEE